MMESFTQILMDWGYTGIFLSALLAGSVLPFSSEVVLAALVLAGLHPAGALLSAALGNTVGGMTCYYLGRLGRTEWIEKYLRVEPAKVERLQQFLRGKGAWMAFFAFLPVVGEAIAVALGFLRSNVPLTVLAMGLGKLARYAAILWLILHSW